MDTHVVIGIALVAAGAADMALAVALVGPRLPAGPQRSVVVGALVSGGALMALVGGAIWLRVIPLG